MRPVGTVFLILGTFLVAAALLALVESRLQAGGVPVFAIVTSVPGTLVAGVVLAFAGLWMRNRPGDK